MDERWGPNGPRIGSGKPDRTERRAAITRDTDASREWRTRYFRGGGQDGDEDQADEPYNPGEGMDEAAFEAALEARR